MSTAPQKLLTSSDYLAIERHAPIRSEFYRGEMFAMSDASWQHNLIKANLAGEVRNHLKNGPCRVVTSDQRVKVPATGLYTYPDVVIVCGEPQFEDNQFDTLVNSTVIIEVLSDSTEKYDRGLKFSHYRKLSTVQEYILASQDHFLLERYVRQPDDTWLLKIYSDLSQSFDFSTIPVRIPLAEIYSGVVFDTTEKADANSATPPTR